jgi:hypothetical protein
MKYLITKEWSVSTPYYFYKTTNLINGKFYYGSGSKENYLGSGKALKRALKKYGKENFKIEKLRFFETRELAYEFEERFLLFFNVCSLKESYNSKNGGLGTAKGTTLSKEHKDKIKQTCLKVLGDSKYRKYKSFTQTGEKNNMYGRTHKESSKKLMSEKKKGLYDGKNNPNYGKRGTESHNAVTYIIEGKEIITAENVALTYNISKKTVFRRVKSDKFPNWRKKL